MLAAQGSGDPCPRGDVSVAEAVLLGIGVLGVVFFLISPPWFGREEGGPEDQ